jgi:hypothetical protein
MVNKCKKALNKLPSSTNSWNCPFFYSIVFFSISIIVAFLTQATVDLSLLSLVFSSLVLGIVLGMRRTGLIEGCQ